MIKLLLQGTHGRICIVTTHIHAATCLRNLLTHLLVEFADYHLSLTILKVVIGARFRDRCSLGLSYTYYEDLNTQFVGFLSSSYGIILMVLTIGNTGA